jgi:DNA-binding NtrC family response regulator
VLDHAAKAIELEEIEGALRRLRGKRGQQKKHDEEHQQADSQAGGEIRASDETERGARGSRQDGGVLHTGEHGRGSQLVIRIGNTSRV